MGTPLGRFCCAGCAAAYEVVTKLGLDQYYAHRNEATASPAVAAEEGAFDSALYTRVEADGTNSVYALIEGLRCAACVWLVESALARQRGVVSARLSYTTRRLRLVWRGTPDRGRELLALVRKLGYRAVAYDLASTMSLFEIFHSGRHTYFDSAVTLLFFLLIGRYLELRARGRARSAAARTCGVVSGAFGSCRLHLVPTLRSIRRSRRCRAPHSVRRSDTSNTLPQQEKFMSAVILGALVSVLGLLELILADGAIDTGMYHLGLVLFGFALLYVFWLIKKHFDRGDLAQSVTLAHVRLIHVNAWAVVRIASASS
jgi:heavy-metal-associated domain-containing protein/cation transport ATPase-like protein